MKFIKLFILLFIFSTGALSAQTKYRLEAGYLQPTRSGSDLDALYLNGTHVTGTSNGIRIGGAAEFDLKYNFSLLTGVSYSVTYLSNAQYYIGNDSINYTTWGHYIDIPLHVNYSIPVGKKKSFRFFAYAGPTFNIGIANPQEVTAVVSNENNQLIEDLYEVTPTSGTYDLFSLGVLNRLNLQLETGGGIQWRNYLLKGGYNFGINNLIKTGSGVLHQSGWYVSMGYEF